MYSMMLDALATTAADFATVTRCTVGGQTISDAVVEAWDKAAGAPLLELWGMTELSAHAYVVPAQGHAPDPDAILAFARTQLAPYKMPKAVHVVAALPTTASGKIRRRDLTPPGMPGT
jgi:acyl-coenzyme A synthetase/AMP-(fatty) acid ligase